jgi:translocation and assembly module TamA
VRWRSPIGPIRFDLAWAVSEHINPWHPRLHINVGPDL